MPFTDLATIDYIVLGIDAVILSAVVLYLGFTYSNMNNCAIITVGKSQLKWFRINLYSAVFSTFTIAFLTFVTSSYLRFIPHPIFVISTAYTLRISLPAYICKITKQIGKCNCDYYEYNDFPLLIFYATFVNILFAALTWSLMSGLIYLMVILLISGLFYQFLPTKDLSISAIPEELLISNISQYQEFIMVDYNVKKLFMVLSKSCKFCDVQLEEINLIPQEFRQKHLRIVDITDRNNVDEMLFTTLNLDPDPDSKIPVPLSFIIDSGMVIDQKDGYISSQEIQYSLI
ncbi:MAG: hypothetical protein INQ03_15010 [Candidatus Heimdallarchaeota archaeon]|nr:hypothetical protein [Candidatus Heimdallarchaeota archaeon]